MNDIGDLLSSVAAATDPGVRAALVAEARQRLVRETLRLRELADLVQAFERQLSTAG